MKYSADNVATEWLKTYDSRKCTQRQQEAIKRQLTLLQAVGMKTVQIPVIPLRRTLVSSP